MRAAVIRRAHFNAAHRLHVDEWSDQENLEIFGPCNNVHYHGHNYELEVKVIGPIDPVSGIVINLDMLKRLIKTEVEDYLDHKNLNVQIKEFQHLNPTVENIAKVIWGKLRLALPDHLDLFVRLHETPRNAVEYPVH